MKVIKFETDLVPNNENIELTNEALAVFEESVIYANFDVTATGGDIANRPIFIVNAIDHRNNTVVDFKVGVIPTCVKLEEGEVITSPNWYQKGDFWYRK